MEHRETPAALERFGAQLAHEIGEPITVGVVPTYAALEAALAAGEAQLAWLPPILRDGASEYCSVLFVRADSDVFTLSDLRGSTVAWVDLCSAAGYLLPRLHLVAEGLRLESLFGQERFLGSHDAVVRAVFDGTADV